MNEIATRPSLSEYAMTVADVQNQVQLIQQIMKSVMKEGEHYGNVPGCGDKKALFKSGAEKLAVTFRLAPEYSITKTDLGGGHREYEVVCKMVHIPTGAVIGQGVGSCSTKETKYRYRNAAKACPECGKETIIKGKEEYGGGWVCFKGKGGCGAKFKDGDKSIEDQASGKVENPDVADVYNTVLKMAKKRAQVDATLTCTGASDIFEQDLDEFSEEELERIRTERGAGDGGGMKPKTDPPKAKSGTTSGTKKTLTDYAAEINAIDTLGDLSTWWKDNAVDLNKTLSKTDNAKFTALFSKRKADVGQPTDDPKKIACPDRDGDMILTSYCDGECKSREGCPAHA